MLMAMCGMMIPASENSVIGMFDELYVDIGDEQSIEQSLSTFSSHMTNIARILRTADEKSLIMLDELCSGTDPVEGSALAVSILDEFRKRDCKVIATTHYQEVKMYAIKTDNVENASCEFDIKTLRPTYRVIVGMPGKSNAFAISSKLGISSDIIDNAKELVSLNDNVYKLRTEVENLSDSIHECKPIISEEIQKLAVEFGATLLYNFLSQIESKCKEAERRIKKASNAIPIPDTAFYILITIVVALSSFFVCMIVANAEILHSGLIWKAVIGCILMVVLGIGIAVIIQKFSDRDK